MQDSSCPCCAARHAAEDAARNAQAVADGYLEGKTRVERELAQALRELEDARAVHIAEYEQLLQHHIQTNTALERQLTDGRWALADADVAWHKVYASRQNVLRAVATLWTRYTEAVEALATARASHERIVALLCAERDAAITTTEQDNDRSTR